MHRRTDYPAHQTATGATQTEEMKKNLGGPRALHPKPKPGKQGKLSKPKGESAGEKKEAGEPHVERYGG